jgi:ATP-dependent Clp protease, protease subunit
MKLSYRTNETARAIASVWGKPLNQAPCFYVKAASGGGAEEILLYDYIGWPFNDAGEVVRAIAGMRGKKITVRINSPGGDIFDAFAIFNALQSHKSKVATRVESLAASAASIILLAGKEVQAYQNAMVMIHEPWIMATGNQHELRDMANILDKISDDMLDIYNEHSNVWRSDLRAMMKAETWLTAKEAKGKGFVDTLVDGKGVEALFDLSVYAHAPAPSTSPAADRMSEAIGKLQVGISLMEGIETLQGSKTFN